MTCRRRNVWLCPSGMDFPVLATLYLLSQWPKFPLHSTPVTLSCVSCFRQLWLLLVVFSKYSTGKNKKIRYCYSALSICFCWPGFWGFGFCTYVIWKTMHLGMREFIIRLETEVVSRVLYSFSFLWWMLWSMKLKITHQLIVKLLAPSKYYCALLTLGFCLNWVSFMLTLVSHSFTLSLKIHQKINSGMCWFTFFFLMIQFDSEAVDKMRRRTKYKIHEQFGFRINSLGPEQMRCGVGNLFSVVCAALRTSSGVELV